MACADARADYIVYDVAEVWRGHEAGVRGSWSMWGAERKWARGRRLCGHLERGVCGAMGPCPAHLRSTGSG